MEALEKPAEVGELSEAALEFLRSKYLSQDAWGRPTESPGDLFHRVSRTVARAEKRFGGEPEEVEGEFLRMMLGLDFLPNSPTLMNAGTTRGQLISAYVLPVGSPAITAHKIRSVQAAGGGVGYSLGNGTSPHHVLRLMELLDSAARSVRQGGRRRGCNVAIMRVDHPQIRQFIKSKSEYRLSNTGISVAVTDEFIRAAERGGDYAIREPMTGEEVGSGGARELLEAVAASVWNTGEPGIVFLDEANLHNPTPSLGQFEAVSPCAEAPLFPNESCILGSINLGNFVYNHEVNFDRLRDVVRTATRFLDDAITANNYPLEETRQTSLQTRKLGLGVMGLADLLADLVLDYGSREAREVSEGLMSFVSRESREISAELALERGPYPLYDEAPRFHGGPLRNATTTAIAPTGSISVLAGCSSGIEPFYAVPQFRRVLEDLVILEENHRFLEVMRTNGGKISDERLARVFRSSWEIPLSDQVKMVAALQRHVDNSVSKTVYLPTSSSEEEVLEVFRLAHRAKCKGISAFRIGSLDGWILKAA